jgi:hypothetical protein
MGSTETPEDVSTDFGMNGGTSLHTRKGQASRSAKHNARDGQPPSVIPVPKNKETSATVACLLSQIHCSFAYSALASFRMGMSGSASFQRAKKSWYAARLLATSPESA